MQVWELISSDNLCVNSEDIVFEAVMGWVKYDIQVCSLGDSGV